jgi:hypothetical protein
MNDLVHTAPPDARPEDRRRAWVDVILPVTPRSAGVVVGEDGRRERGARPESRRLALTLTDATQRGAGPGGPEHVPVRGSKSDTASAIQRFTNDQSQ